MCVCVCVCGKFPGGFGKTLPAGGKVRADNFEKPAECKFFQPLFLFEFRVVYVCNRCDLMRNKFLWRRTNSAKPYYSFCDEADV